MQIFRKDRILKTLAYLILTILTAALETSVLSNWRILGATPELLPFVAAAAAVYEGPMAAVWSGFFVGLLMDGLGAKSLWWYTVSMTGMSALIAAISPHLFRPRWTTAVLWGALMQLISEFFRFFVVFYLFSRADLSAVVTVLLPQLLISVLLSPLIIAPLAALHRVCQRDTSLFR